MGWYGTCEGTKESVVKEILENKGIVDHSLVGNHLWVLFDLDGLKFITLFLLGAMGLDSRSYGYKPIDETMGPVDLDCPMRLINKASAPSNDFSKEWRQKVAEYHHVKKMNKFAVSTLNIGDTIELREGSKPRVLRIKTLKPLRGISQDFMAGAVFRLTPKSMDGFRKI